MKLNATNKKLEKFVLIVFSMLLSSSVFILMTMHQTSIAQATDSLALDGLGSSDSTLTGSSGTATTNVYLTADSQQLKFSAPSRIDFILDGDGNFTAPTEASITNDSVMDIEIANYKVVSEEGCTGVENADDPEYASQQDVYSVKVIPTHSTTTSNTEYSFSTSYNVTEQTNNDDWTITKSEKSIKLLFDKGRMPNPSRKWSETAAKLQTVTWTVKTAS